MRNNLLFNGKVVSFKNTEDTYELDKKKSTTSRSLLHITDAHINTGPFQMMCKFVHAIIYSHKV